MSLNKMHTLKKNKNNFCIAVANWDGGHCHIPSWLPSPLASSSLPAGISSASNSNSRCYLPLPVSFPHFCAAASVWVQNNN